jgi:hypothetical protein
MVDERIPVTTSPTPLRKAMSIERSVEEGLIIARAALTMDVKNYIIIRAVRDGHPFDLDEVVEEAKRHILELAHENATSGARIQQLAEEVLTPAGAQDDSEGYQAEDAPTLTKRGVIHDLVSDELERLSEDDAYLGEVAEHARVRAWAEVGDAIEDRLLESLPKPPDQYYEEDKDARIRALYNINLKALERQAKRRRAPRDPD